MSLLVTLIRLALCAVFGVAGATKLLDPGGTREALKNFGAPKLLVPALSLWLPILELTVAAGLLVDSSTSIAAVGALLLLGVFIVAISINLAQGRTHDCHCFGQLHSRPLGWPTLLRNIIFALGAGFVLWQALTAPVPGIVPVMFALESTQLLLLIAGVVAVAVTLVLFSRRYKRQAAEATTAQETPQGLPLETIAPAFELPAYHGGNMSLAQLIAYGKPLMLIFASPTCPPCVALFEEIKDWQRAHNEQLTIGLISKGTIKENFVNVARNSLGEVLLQKDREVAAQYNALLTPTAVVVSTNGRIASPLAAGAEEIRNLLQTILENSNGSPRLPS